MTSPTEQSTIDALHNSWVWITPWAADTASADTAARLVTFQRKFRLDTVPTNTTIHCTADTRYKLLVNGHRVALGPARSSPSIWLYDTIDIAPFLTIGDNEVTVTVLRFSLTIRAGMPFVRTQFPGLSIVGTIGCIDLGTLSDGWKARVEDNIKFPYGLVDDAFLNIYERGSPVSAQDDYKLVPKPYAFKTVNGELAPWRLHARPYDLPEQSPVHAANVYAVAGSGDSDMWTEFLQRSKPITLDVNTHARVDFSVDCHSTAFTRWKLAAPEPTSVTLRITYSEGYEYEKEGREYPWFRTKGDRLDSVHGKIIGPYDEVTLEVGPEAVVYEPFWFRTFRLIRLEVVVASGPVQLVSFEATQTNYALGVKASWQEPQGEYSDRIWDISVRTLRNCMYDGYSDCPFYEQLQYAGDGRSVCLFHYLLSGDDRLARQAILSFASSVTAEGLTQSRHPSHITQVIAGFSLYWCLMVSDHMLYFNDIQLVRSLLPRIDGVLEFFQSHVDHLGLVSGISPDIWQYVDWVDGWHATDNHPDKGVPTAGRATNRHTFFSMLYAFTLRQMSTLLQQVGRIGLVAEYEARADAVVAAIRKHCYDGHFFTDAAAVDVEKLPPTTPTPYSQHCQVFAVLCGAVQGAEAARLLGDAFAPDSKLGKCSYVMLFYAFRAFALAGPAFYRSMFSRALAPWRRMVDKNLTTWEEDDVRERSDCHAWGSVPIYEFAVEVAGVRPVAPGWSKIEFDPKPDLAEGDEVDAKVALGRDNVATVSWKKGDGVVLLKLVRPTEVLTRAVDGSWKSHGVVTEVAAAV